MLEIKKLTDISLEELTAVFNLSFSDYFIPLQITKEQLVQKMETENILLPLSVGAFRNNRLISFILHGLNKKENRKVLYNGGTGVIPAERGNHLTQKMYAYAISFLKEESIDHIILEVLTQNLQAQKAYKATGFTEERELCCFRGEIISDLPVNNHIVINQLKDLPWPELKTYWDVEPAWQNAPAVADKLFSTNISLGAYLTNQLAGYIIYNPIIKRIQQLAVKKEFRNQHIATTLLQQIVKQYGSNISITNVDTNAVAACRFFSKSGLHNYVNQLEMIYYFS